MNLDNSMRIGRCYAQMSDVAQKQLDNILDVGIRAAYEMGILNLDVLSSIKIFLREVGGEEAQCLRADIWTFEMSL